MTNRILIAGESWITHALHIKGFDSFTTSSYEVGVGYLQSALEEAGYDVTFMPNHAAHSSFPTDLSDLKKFDLVMLSDIGANTLLLHPDTFAKSVPLANRLDLISEFVHGGGGLVMVGGYLSFQGIEGKANYKNSPIEDILPVTLLAGDDRREMPSGAVARVVSQNHPCVKDLDSEWPMLLGYNQLIAREDAEVVAVFEDDPILAVREVGKGRTAVFASDCGPHWAPPEFVEWAGYKILWKGIADWVVGKI
jgi:uncharacterized membrane protein